jgi:hypothetical protein
MGKFYNQKQEMKNEYNLLINCIAVFGAETPQILLREPA